MFMFFASKYFKRRIAKSIVKCFKDVDFTKQYFNIDSVPVKSSNGDTVFYSSIEIDKGIMKLNKLLRYLGK